VPVPPSGSISDACYAGVALVRAGDPRARGPTVSTSLRQGRPWHLCVPSATWTSTCRRSRECSPVVTVAECPAPMPTPCGELSGDPLRQAVLRSVAGANPTGRSGTDCTFRSSREGAPAHSRRLPSTRSSATDEDMSGRGACRQMMRAAFRTARGPTAEQVEAMVELVSLYPVRRFRRAAAADGLSRGRQAGRLSYEQCKRDQVSRSARCSSSSP